MKRTNDLSSKVARHSAVVTCTMVLAVLIALTLVACQKADAPLDNEVITEEALTSMDTTIPDNVTVLADTASAKITTTGIKTFGEGQAREGYSKFYLELYVENHTDHLISLPARQVVIGGYCVDGWVANYVSPHKSAKTYIAFGDTGYMDGMSSTLNNVPSVSGTFTIIDCDNDEVLEESMAFRYENPSSSGDSTGYNPMSGMSVFQNDSIDLRYMGKKSYTYDEETLVVKFAVVNSTDHNLVVRLTDPKLNGIAASPENATEELMMQSWAEAAPNSTTFIDVLFTADALKAFNASVSSVSSLGANLTVTDLYGDNGMTYIVEAEPIEIEL